MFRETAFDVEALATQSKTLYDADPRLLYIPSMKPMGDTHSFADPWMNPEP